MILEIVLVELRPGLPAAPYAAEIEDVVGGAVTILVCLDADDRAGGRRELEGRTLEEVDPPLDARLVRVENVGRGTVSTGGLLSGDSRPVVMGKLDPDPIALPDIIGVDPGSLADELHVLAEAERGETIGLGGVEGDGRHRTMGRGGDDGLPVAGTGEQGTRCPPGGGVEGVAVGLPLESDVGIGENVCVSLVVDDDELSHD